VKSIFDATRRVSLGIGRQQEFKAMLTSDSATLRLITVEAAKDAFLGKEARVGGKYRLTPTGGSQLFSAMSPGLYQMLRYVETSTKNVTGSDKVAKIAAEIVNRVAVLQEHALVTKKLVCCETRKQLDGFVGAKYRLVTNASVFDMLLESCDAMRGRPKFFIGELLGREMTAVLLAEKPIKDKLHAGIVLQNSETAGRAIRVAVVLYDRKTGHWSVSPFTRETRIPHLRSKQIRNKMQMLPDSLAKQQKLLEGSVAEYENSNKDLLIRTPADNALAKLHTRLMSRAVSHGVSSADLTAAIDAFGVATSEKQARPSIATLYDACCSVADCKPCGRSISLRQLAFGLVFNFEG